MGYSMKKSKWSESIYLPETEFPMKAELSKREPEAIAFWEKHKTYKKLLQSREKQADRFILHDGPPYANGRFHVGHALNKILKDLINKYNLLKGSYVNYVPGWDCHGLPIELAVMKKAEQQKRWFVKISPNDPKSVQGIRTRLHEATGRGPNQTEGFLGPVGS